MPPVANAQNIFRDPRIAPKKTSRKKDTQVPEPTLAPVVPPRCNCRERLREEIIQSIGSRGDLSKGQKELFARIAGEILG